jgi:hypothetical protein
LSWACAVPARAIRPNAKAAAKVFNCITSILPDKPSFVARAP